MIDTTPEYIVVLWVLIGALMTFLRLGRFWVVATMSAFLWLLIVAAFKIVFYL